MTITAAQSIEKARRQLESGLPREALKTLARSSVPTILRPERNFLEAEAWRHQGFFIRAERFYARVRTRGVLRQDPALWIEAGLALAACRRSLGGVAEARKYLRDVASTVRTRRWKHYLDRIRLEEALTDRAEGLYGKSLAEFSDMLGQHIEEREWEEAAFVLWAMGGALRFAGDLEGSRKTFERSRILAHRAKDPIGEAYALFGLGGVTRIMGRLEDSARCYSAAGRKLSKTQDIFGQAYAQCGLANALRQLGKLDAAERHYARSHKLYSRLEDEVDLTYVEWGLGKVYMGRGKTKRAIPYLRRALKLFRRHREPRGDVLAGVALAQALHAAGRTIEAEALFRRSYKLADRSGLHAHLETFT